MKKLITKVVLKSAIQALAKETASKVVKLAESNGFKIITYHGWNNISDSDVKYYPNGKQVLKDITPFAEEDLDSLINIITDIVTDRFEVATHADIERFIRVFDDKKATYDKEQNSANAAKIARLKKRIAKAQAELNSLTA